MARRWNFGMAILCHLVVHQSMVKLFILFVAIITSTSFFVLVATPLWPSVRVKPNTPKVGDLESSGTIECLEFDSKGQNTSH